jgi:hypothetical protein
MAEFVFSQFRTIRRKFQSKKENELIRAGFSGQVKRESWQ